MEKRLPIAMVVNLAPANVRRENETEMTYTNNVSAHGACLVSSHPWLLGEIAEVTSISDKVSMRGKVVHCRKSGSDRYFIGLSFQNGDVVWSIYLRYAGQNKRATELSRKHCQ